MFTLLVIGFVFAMVIIIFMVISTILAIVPGILVLLTLLALDYVVIKRLVKKNNKKDRL